MAGYALSMPDVVTSAPHQLPNTRSTIVTLISIFPGASLSQYDESYLMASPESPDASLFEETQISSAVTEDAVPQFFQEHGIFYESDAEIGRLADTLGAEGLDRDTGISKFRAVYLGKPRCRKLLEHFRPDFAYIIGADGYFYTATTSEEESKDRITVFMLRPGTVLEFAVNSQVASFETLSSPYRLRIIPYKQIRGLFKEIPVRLKDGGILVVHPRMAFRPHEGSGHVYAGPTPDFASQQS